MLKHQISASDATHLGLMPACVTIIKSLRGSASVPIYYNKNNHASFLRPLIHLLYSECKLFRVRVISDNMLIQYLIHMGPLSQ